MEEQKPFYPFPPMPQHVSLPRIYPWENLNFTLILKSLYKHAIETGFKGTFIDFKDNYGRYLDVLNPYTGSYQVIPLAKIDQILRTKDTMLSDDIIVEEIPYAQTSNLAGGYTVTIG